MKDILRDFLTFSAAERKGVVVLIILLIVISGINLIVVMVHPAAGGGEYPQWMKDTGAVFLPASQNDAFDGDTAYGMQPFQITGDEQVLFDPNEASYEVLMKIGLGKKVSRTILNYRLKGGKFKTPEDLKKIYGLSSYQYERIAEYIRIRPGTASLQKEVAFRESAKKRMVDINHADSTILEGLPGIGPVLARRIVKYRSLLGGYYNTGQIREVYGMSDSIYMRIADLLIADTVMLKKINLNTASEKDLARHPYLGRYAAGGIISYRKQVTYIRNINELKINGLIPAEMFDKIKNYISI